jgi:membrane-associated phospholipid phosphatase
VTYEHPADNRRVLVRAARDARAAAGRADARLLLGLLGVVALAVAAVPLAILVRREFAPLVRLDAALTATAQQAVAESTLLLAVARLVTLLGDPLLLTALAALLAGWLVLSGRRRLALYVVVARVGAVVLSSVLKVVIDRVRPVFDEPVAVALGGSFPSGHALGSAAFYLTTAVVLRPLLTRRRRRTALRAVLVAAVVVPLAVAASRVLLGVHYLTDVAAGLLLGAGWAALVTAAFAAWRVEEGGAGSDAATRRSARWTAP